MPHRTGNPNRHPVYTSRPNPSLSRNGVQDMFNTVDNAKPVYYQDGVARPIETLYTYVQDDENVYSVE